MHFSFLFPGGRSGRRFAGHGLITVPVMVIFLLSSLNSGAQPLRELGGRKAAFDELFQEKNVGNLHVFSPTEEEAMPSHFFHGEEIPRGFFGLFAENWREELPEDTKAHAVFKIRNGRGNAYILRFAGADTRNMIALFSFEADKLIFRRTLSMYYCGQGVCYQMDSWVRDFDGDARLDILQRARMTQTAMLEAPVDTYVQPLRQTEDGTFVETRTFEYDLSDYNFEPVDQ